MKMEGQHRFSAPQADIYQVFTDPDALARATPGVQKMTSLGDDRYEATLKVGVAGISGTYTGTIALTAQRPPEHYELNIVGRGAPGYVQGTAVFNFAPDGAGTQVDYVWDVQVGGLVAGVGQRVMGGVARMMINQFMQAMEKELVRRQSA